MKQVDPTQIQWRCFWALLALLSLSQCALPPGTAWTVIRRDGVKDYLAISWGKKPVPDYVKELLPEAFGEAPRVEDSGESEDLSEGGDPALASGDAFPPLPSSMPQDWERPVEPVFPLMSTDPPEFPSLTPPILAQHASPNLPLDSFPLEDDEFAQVHVPDFLKAPGAVSMGPDGGLSKPAPGLKMKDMTLASVTEDKQSLASTPGLPAETVAVPQAAVAVSAAESKNTTEEPEPTAAKKEDDIEKFLPVMPSLAGAETIPFGILVPTRPGYVRSPFAKAHQLVDVTGLKTGETVTCPFAGKPFRVPGAEGTLNPVPAPTKEAKLVDPVPPKAAQDASE